jgi:hypothetical protein
MHTYNARETAIPSYRYIKMTENCLFLCSRFTSTTTATTLLLLLLLLSLDNTNIIGFGGVLGFVVVVHHHHHHHRQSKSDLFATTSTNELSLGIGEYMIELEKPLGMILEECGGNGGVQVQEVIKGKNAGNAWKSNFIAPREILSTIDGTDVSKCDFDTVMNLLTSSSSSTSTVQLVFSDGLGQFDMPKNVVSRLKTTEDAFFIDSIARQAVRECRRDGRLGDLLNVEVIIGAGISNSNNNKDNNDEWNEHRRGMVRFFAIFSTDGVTTYSCNVSATGIDISGDDDNNIHNHDTGTNVCIKQNENNSNIKIVSLSCAKDEGLGRTFDLIVEL